MAESTFGNEVYLDKDGKVVDKRDKNALTKISRGEAERRGLLPKTDASRRRFDEQVTTFADGSTIVSSGTMGSPPASVTPVLEEDEEETDEKDAKAVKSAPEDKAVHRTGKK